MESMLRGGMIMEKLTGSFNEQVAQACFQFEGMRRNNYAKPEMRYCVCRAGLLNPRFVEGDPEIRWDDVEFDDRTCQVCKSAKQERKHEAVCGFTK